MSKRVLFVEDERWGVTPYFRELIKRGIECTIVKNGDEVMEQLNTQQFDFISMDIMFPPGDSLGKDTKASEAGVKLLQLIREGQIKNCPPAIKVVILTAVVDSGIENQIRKLGVSAYLKKPIEFSNVIETYVNL